MANVNTLLLKSDNAANAITLAKKFEMKEPFRKPPVSKVIKAPSDVTSGSEESLDEEDEEDLIISSFDD